MSHISFALLQAHSLGATVADIATRLQLPEAWVEERIAAARMCLAQAALSDSDSQQSLRMLAADLEYLTRAA